MGANIGYYTVFFSKLVGKLGRVVSFEPTNYFRKVLKINLEVNKIKNADVM